MQKKKKTFRLDNLPMLSYVIINMCYVWLFGIKDDIKSLESTFTKSMYIPLKLYLFIPFKATTSPILKSDILIAIWKKIFLLRPYPGSIVNEKTCI